MSTLPIAAAAVSLRNEPHANGRKSRRQVRSSAGHTACDAERGFIGLAPVAASVAQGRQAVTGAGPVYGMGGGSGKRTLPSAG